MQTVRILYITHLAALAFAVTGAMVFMRDPAPLGNPPLIKTLPLASQLDDVGYILLGATSLLFALSLSLRAGLWAPLIIAVACALASGALAIWLRRSSVSAARGHPKSVRRVAPGTVNPHFERFAQAAITLVSALVLARSVDVAVEGLENVPKQGAVLIVSRHFHHLFDGAIFMTRLRHPVHIFVALDWARTRWVRAMVKWACRVVAWPGVLRADASNAGRGQSDGSRHAYRLNEAGRYLRLATATSVAALRSGDILVIFPEAYPNIDPHGSPKADEDAFLPFAPGFVKLAQLAERDGRTRVSVVPAGFDSQTLSTGRQRITVRFGAPVLLTDFPDREQLVAYVERTVKALSAATPTYQVALRSAESGKAARVS